MGGGLGSFGLDLRSAAFQALVSDGDMLSSRTEVVEESVTTVGPTSVRRHGHSLAEWRTRPLLVRRQVPLPAASVTLLQGASKHLVACLQNKSLTNLSHQVPVGLVSCQPVDWTQHHHTSALAAVPCPLFIVKQAVFHRQLILYLGSCH